jgi:hypothetical protein
VNSPLRPTTVASKPSWLCGIGLRAPAAKSHCPPVHEHRPLEGLGYVERRVDPDDVRSRRVYLTPLGTCMARFERRGAD